MVACLGEGDPYFKPPAALLVTFLFRERLREETPTENQQQQKIMMCTKIQDTRYGTTPMSPPVGSSAGHINLSSPRKLV